jgi:hypothetical protein
MKGLLGTKGIYQSVKQFDGIDKKQAIKKAPKGL